MSTPDDEEVPFNELESRYEDTGSDTPGMLQRQVGSSPGTHNEVDSDGSYDSDFDDYQRLRALNAALKQQGGEEGVPCPCFELCLQVLDAVHQT